MVSGVAMFGTISGLAASFFLKSPATGPSEDTKAILARLDKMQALLDRMDSAGTKQP
jgi:hypothetical protein